MLDGVVAVWVSILREGDVTDDAPSLVNALYRAAARDALRRVAPAAPYQSLTLAAPGMAGGGLDELGLWVTDLELAAAVIHYLATGIDRGILIRAEQDQIMVEPDSELPPGAVAVHLITEHEIQVELVVCLANR